MDTNERGGGYFFMPSIWGGFIGDICGSVLEFSGFKTDRPEEIELMVPGCDFTDDSILMKATMDACHRGAHRFAESFEQRYREYGKKFPNPMGGYGAGFGAWLKQPNAGPYDSFGNGAAVRAAPVGAYGLGEMQEVMDTARRTAEPTHSHPEGIKGAQATAAAVWLAIRGEDRKFIRKYITHCFGYQLDLSVQAIRHSYKYDESCQETVPAALMAFFDSGSFAHAIKLALSLGGDADSLACITGSVAGAYYGKNEDLGIHEDLFRFAYDKVNGKLGEYDPVTGEDTVNYIWR